MKPHLECMNCYAPVQPDTAKVFAGVFCCPDCFAMAHSLYEKGEKELTSLLILMKEAIRIALVEGKLRLGPQDMENISKADVLKEIVRLEELRESKHGR